METITIVVIFVFLSFWTGAIMGNLFPITRSLKQIMKQKKPILKCKGEKSK